MLVPSERTRYFQTQLFSFYCDDSSEEFYVPPDLEELQLGKQNVTFTAGRPEIRLPSSLPTSATTNLLIDRSMENGCATTFIIDSSFKSFFPSKNSQSLLFPASEMWLFWVLDYFFCTFLHKLSSCSILTRHILNIFIIYILFTFLDCCSTWFLLVLYFHSLTSLLLCTKTSKQIPCMCKPTWQ